MAAEHDEFVFQLGIRAGNFGDSVETVFVVAGEFCIDVEFDAYRNSGFQQAVDAAVIFNGRDRDGQCVRMFALIDQPTEACPSVVENRAARAAVVSAVAARSDHGDRLLGGQEMADFFAESKTLEKSREGKGA